MTGDNLSESDRIAAAEATALSGIISPDPKDPRQIQARDALGAAANAALYQLSLIEFATPPSQLTRVMLTYARRAVTNLFDAHFLLGPTGRVHAHAAVSSLLIRSAADMYARVMAIAVSDDPDTELRGQLARSIDQEVMALEAAQRAGADVGTELESHGSTKNLLGVESKKVNVVDTLQGANEFEVLAAYRWESAHVHFGVAALNESTRSFVHDGVTIDVGISPVQPWRLGQLTWAVYAIDMKLLLAAAELAEVEIAGLREIDAAARSTIRETALREKASLEPDSPPYGSMDFGIEPLRNAD